MTFELVTGDLVTSQLVTLDLEFHLKVVMAKITDLVSIEHWKLVIGSLPVVLPV